MSSTRIFHSPLGRLRISGDEKGIFEVAFSTSDVESGPENIHVNLCIKELDEYFKGLRKKFTVSVYFKSGTLFQRKVWNALTGIEYGKTRSYMEIAEICSNPKASRAVGNANNKNPVSIIVPCHRVIGKNGELRGYGGGVDKKLMLISLEKDNSSY